MKLWNAKDKAFGKSGDYRYGYCCQLTDPSATDIFGAAGYDYVIIDAEHCEMDSADVANHIRAAIAHDMLPIVRVVDVTRRSIQYAADAGAMGLIIPCVRTAADVKKAVELARYDALLLTV